MITVIALSILLIALLNSIEIVSKIIIATITTIITVLLLAAISGAAIFAVAHKFNLI